MKKILKDMRINSLISVLHIIAALAVMGAVVLYFQRETLMQLLGLSSGSGEIKNDDLFICGLGALMILLALFVLIKGFFGNQRKEAAKLISGLDAAEQEKLLMDYQNAWKASRTIRIGQKYSYMLDGGQGIYLNSDIIWIYEWKESRRSNGVTSDFYYFDLYILGKEKPDTISVDRKSVV